MRFFFSDRNTLRNQVGACCGVLCLALASACELINPAEAIPAYIHVQPFELVANDRTEGSASARITEVWVFLQGDFLGAYSLPATLPLLASGPAELRLEAGIRENGIAATPNIYPFFEPFTQTLDLLPARTDTLLPQTRYRQEAQFAFIEPFEQTTHLFRNLISGHPSENRIRIDEQEVFEGNSSGRIELDTLHPAVEIATSRRYRDLSQLGSSVFLEVNYRSEISVSFGVIGYFDNPILPPVVLYQAGFLPRDDWNKIYFDLTPAIVNSQADEFQIVLNAQLPTDDTNNFTRPSARVWLDNIKLLHF